MYQLWTETIILKLEGVCVLCLQPCIFLCSYLPTCMSIYFLSVWLLPVPHIYICVGQHTHTHTHTVWCSWIDWANSWCPTAPRRQSSKPAHIHRPVVPMKLAAKWVISVNISRQTRPLLVIPQLFFSFGFTCQMTLVSARRAIVPEVI